MSSSESSSIEVVVNDRAVTLGAGATVKDMLAAQGLGGSPCAVEVNRELVRHAEHGTRALAEGDRVEVVTLVGGG